MATLISQKMGKNKPPELVIYILPLLRPHTSTINKILRNEKYIGDTLLQKTYTTDFLSKTRVKNTGIVPQYYVEGNHEAIIPRKIYMRAQEELVR